MNRYLPSIIFMIACGFVHAAAHAATWAEPMYGMSIKYPDAYRTVEQTTDRALVKFITQDEIVGSLYIEPQFTDQDLPEIKQKALSQLAFGAKQPELVDESPHRTYIADRRAHWWTLRTETEHGGNVIFGQCFIMISPRRVAVIQVEADWNQREQATAFFHQLMDGFALQDQEELAQTHIQRLEQGDHWLSGILEAMTQRPDARTSWYLIEQNDKVIGYERRIIRPTNELGVDGLSAEVQRKTTTESQSQTTILRAFASADRAVEIWEARTSIQSGNALNQPEINTAFTAVRMKDILRVTIESPTRNQQKDFTIPELGYLPLAHQIAMGPGWRDAAGEPFAYFSYYMPVEHISFALAEVNPTPEGWTIRLYPAPRRAVQTLTFDHDGNLITHTTPDGKTLRKTTPERISQLFRD